MLPVTIELSLHFLIVSVTGLPLAAAPNFSACSSTLIICLGFIHGLAPSCIATKSQFWFISFNPLETEFFLVIPPATIFISVLVLILSTRSLNCGAVFSLITTVSYTHLTLPTKA